MKPAKLSRRYFEKTKLMIVRPNFEDSIVHRSVGELPEYLREGDLLVVNRSGTLPSSFRGAIARTGEFIELRLAAFRGGDPRNLARWAAVSFGNGDWRQPTENRGRPPELRVGDVINFQDDLKADVRAVDHRHSRLLEIEFSSPHLARSLFENGKPIQYSYLEEELQVWDQQTIFSGPPISVEPPSAAFPLNWSQILKLKQKGVGLTTVLHGAGLSSTGDVELDARFPLDEYFEVSPETVMRIQETGRRGGRVIALGTTVTRALESTIQNGEPSILKGYTSLKLGLTTELKVTDALITGMHEDGTSHAELMKAFCGCEYLQRAEQEAHRLQYRSHEYGDLTFLDCKK